MAGGYSASDRHIDGIVVVASAMTGWLGCLTMSGFQFGRAM